jgi:hypothetical protein
MGEVYIKGFQIGQSVLDAISGEIIKFYYKRKYERVFITGEVWHQEYECSSIEEYREFHQKTYPLKNGIGLVIVNTLVTRMPMNQKRAKEYNPLEKLYTQESGYINQCSNCRLVQRVAQTDRWDWVPTWIKVVPSNISHTICPECNDYYWKYGSLTYDPDTQTE